MKVLLYTESKGLLAKSGLGKAIEHQKKALESVGISYTLDPNDDYDIVHLNFYGLKSYYLAKRAKKKGTKVIYHAHSTEEDFRNSFVLSNQLAPFFRKWIIKCYSLGNYIITPTLYSKKILEGYGINQPIRAISNGIELDFFKRKENDRIHFLNKYHYKPDDKIIVGIGLYIERKGILDFVELAKRLPQYQFIWFGYTPLYAVPMKIKRAVQTKLPNLFFAGYVEKEQIREALVASNLYLFPTCEETEGIPIIEACAVRQDALIRDIKVFEGWLTNGQNVYKAKTLEEFEQKIKDILEGRLPSLKNYAYLVAEKRDIKEVGKQLKDIYETVLK